MAGNLLLQKISTHDESNIVDIAVVKKAISFAKRYHGNQLRQTGEKYWHHLISVASGVVNHACETNIIVIAILHDILEDTELSLQKLEIEFNKIIADGVQYLTNKAGESLEKRINSIMNTSNNSISPKTEHILLVKLLDRLDNLRTIYVKKPEKRKAIVLETENILLPIAKHLLYHDIFDEMRHLCQIYR